MRLVRRRFSSSTVKQVEQTTIAEAQALRRSTTFQFRFSIVRNPQPYQFANVVPIMFVLTEFHNTLRVPPESLSIPLQDAITKELAHLYFDKVPQKPSHSSKFMKCGSKNIKIFSIVTNSEIRVRFSSKCEFDVHFVCGPFSCRRIFIDSNLRETGSEGFRTLCDIL